LRELLQEEKGELGLENNRDKLKQYNNRPERRGSRRMTPNDIKIGSSSSRRKSSIADMQEKIMAKNDILLMPGIKPQKEAEYSSEITSEISKGGEETFTKSVNLAEAHPENAEVVQEVESENGSSEYLKSVK